jgi:hypothetical protein
MIEVELLPSAMDGFENVELELATDSWFHDEVSRVCQ